MTPGPGSYVPIPGMHGHMLQPPVGLHMNVPPARGTPDRKMRGQAPAAAPTTAAVGQSKRGGRVGRNPPTRAATLQTVAPTTPSLYPSQVPQPSHPGFPQQGYAPWPQQQQQQQQQQQPQQMMSSYPNQIKQQPQPTHVMQNIRPAALQQRPGVQYANPSMIQQQQQQQQQQNAQQQQGQPTQMSAGYMNDQTSMMNQNSSRQAAAVAAAAAASGKRKLAEANMYSNDQQQYAAPQKMSQYQQNPVMMQQNNYMQQAPQQQTSHQQIYNQGQMPSGPYMNNQILANPAKYLFSLNENQNSPLQLFLV